MKWLTWSQVAQEPPTPPRTEQVVEEPGNTQVALKTPKQNQRDDLGNFFSTKA